MKARPEELETWLWGEEWGRSHRGVCGREEGCRGRSGAVAGSPWERGSGSVAHVEHGMKWREGCEELEYVWGTQPAEAKRYVTFWFKPDIKTISLFPPLIEGAKGMFKPSCKIWDVSSGEIVWRFGLRPTTNLPTKLHLPCKLLQSVMSASPCCTVPPSSASDSSVLWGAIYFKLPPAPLLLELQSDFAGGLLQMLTSLLFLLIWKREKQHIMLTH